MFCKILALELQEGWTALHCAAHAGYLDVAKLLVESGASAEVVPLDYQDSSNSTFADQDKPKDMLIYVGQDETKNGRVALWYAASEGHNAVTLICN